MTNRKLIQKKCVILGCLLTGIAVFVYPAGSPIFAKTFSLEGKIKSIERTGAEEYLLTVEGERGETSYHVDQATLITVFTPAKSLSVGQKILTDPVPEDAGSGQPNLPKIPPPPPSFPQLLKENPGAPSEELKNQPAGQERAKKQGPKADTDPAWRKDALTFLTQTTNLTPTGFKLPPPPGTPQAAAKRVVKLSVSPRWIEASVEDNSGTKEDLMWQPEEKVTCLLLANDLHEAMSVSLKIEEDSGNEKLRRVTVL